MTRSTATPFTLADLDAAAEVVYRSMAPTPQLSWPLLSAEVGTQVWVKHENHTPIAAFKVRGGLVHLRRLRDRVPSLAGVASATQGNHGQSLAFAGRALGLPVVIVVPHGNNPDKNDAMRALGAQVVGARPGLRGVPAASGRPGGPAGPDTGAGVSPGAGARGRDLRSGALRRRRRPRRGLRPGRDGVRHRRLDRVRDLLGLPTQIVGVVAAGAPAYALSVAAGTVVGTDRADTFVDGVACRQPDPDAVEVIRRGAARVVPVPDERTATAMRTLLRCAHNLPAAGRGPRARRSVAGARPMSRASGRRRPVRRQRRRRDAARRPGPAPAELTTVRRLAPRPTTRAGRGLTSRRHGRAGRSRTSGHARRGARFARVAAAGARRDSVPPNRYREEGEAMKAVVYHGPGAKSWEEVPDPTISADTDAIVRVDATTICGTDLHILKGDVPAVTDGRILGHEAVGTVEAVGAGVQTVRPGDRVLVSCITACGRCRYCRDGAYGQCLGGGGWILGHLIDGTQAEYVRVPFADTSTYPIPAETSDEDVLMLADILPTGYEVGVLNGTVRPGDTVAVVGAGPIGLSAMVGTRLFSPSSVVAIDLADTRLDAAKQFGADVTINNGREDAVQRVRERTDGLGADVAIEAVGVPPSFELCTELVRPGGHVANVGVHGSPATLHLETLWIRNITVTTGLVDTYSTPTLLRLVSSGQLDASRFVTHRFALADFLSAYDVFGRAAETGALKVVLSR